MQHKLIVDQGMGTIQFPEYLRSKGYEAFTIKDVFGRGNVIDEEWLKTAGENNWIAFTKDKAIRRNTAELNAVIAHKAKLICFVHTNIPFEETSEIFEKHWKKIENWFDKPAPWMLTVSRSEVKAVKLHNPKHPD